MHTRAQQLAFVKQVVEEKKAEILGELPSLNSGNPSFVSVIVEDGKSDKDQYRILYLADNQYVIYTPETDVTKGAFGRIFRGFKINGKGELDEKHDFAIKQVDPDMLAEVNTRESAVMQGTPAYTLESQAIAMQVMEAREVKGIQLSYDPRAKALNDGHYVSVVSTFLTSPDLVADPKQDEVKEGKEGKEVQPIPWSGLKTASYVKRYQLCQSLFEKLAAFHDAGFTHGDVRGANVKISKDGVVLLDFDNLTESKGGLVKSKKEEIGSPGLMMPEYFSNEGIMLGPKTDNRAALPILYTIFDPETDPLKEKRKKMKKGEVGLLAYRDEMSVPYVFNESKCIPPNSGEFFVPIQLFQLQFFKRLNESKYDKRPTSREGAEFFKTIVTLCDLQDKLHPSHASSPRLRKNIETEMHFQLAKLAIIASFDSSDYLTCLEGLKEKDQHAKIYADVSEAIEILGKNQLLENNDNILKQILFTQDDKLIKKLIENKDKSAELNKIVKEYRAIPAFQEMKKLPDILKGLNEKDPCTRFENYTIFYRGKNDYLVYDDRNELAVGKGAFGAVYVGYPMNSQGVMDTTNPQAIKEIAINQLDIDPTEALQKAKDKQKLSLFTKDVKQSGPEHLEATQVMAMEKLQSEVAGIRKGYDPKAKLVAKGVDYLCVISKFVPGQALVKDPSGDQKGFLPWEALKDFDFEHRLKLIIKLFGGLDQLHTDSKDQPSIVHGDLRGSNIHVNFDKKSDDFEVVFLDYDKAQRCKPKERVVFEGTDIGSQGAMMPEYFEAKMMLGPKMDVRGMLPLVYAVWGEENPWGPKIAANEGASKEKKKIAGSAVMDKFKPELTVPYAFHPQENFKKLSIPITEEVWDKIALFQEKLFKRMESKDYDQVPTSADCLKFYLIVQHVQQLQKAYGKDAEEFPSSREVMLLLAQLALISSGISYDRHFLKRYMTSPKHNFNIVALGLNGTLTEDSLKALTPLTADPFSPSPSSFFPASPKSPSSPSFPSSSSDSSSLRSDSGSSNGSGKIPRSGSQKTD